MIPNKKLIELIKGVASENPDLPNKNLVEEVMKCIKKGSFFSNAELQALRDEISERIFNA